jgi:hypothetical protein
MRQFAAEQPEFRLARLPTRGGWLAEWAIRIRELRYESEPHG